jgi:hypothetical protein
VSRLSRGECEEILAEARSPRARANFAAAERVCDEWDRAHPTTLEGILDWIEQLRQLFGDPPVDREPWRGDDFKLS